MAAGGSGSIQMNDANVPDGGPPFFAGAPLSKAMTVFVVVFFLLGETMGLHLNRSLALDWDRVFTDGEIWRVCTCHWTFESVGVLLFGLAVLCPWSRRFEREMGTRRFATFLVLSTTLATLLEFLLETAELFTASSFRRASGPHAVLGALLCLYHIHTPRLHPRFLGVLGLDFSEKAVPYALMAQLLYAEGWPALVPTLCGVAGAGLSITPPLRLLGRCELPQWVDTVGRVLGTPFVDEEEEEEGGEASLRRHPVFQGQQRTVQRHTLRPGGLGGARPAPAPQPFPVAPPPPEETIESLTAMGFEREMVIRTLQQCDNNVEVAANRLLSNAS